MGLALIACLGILGHVIVSTETSAVVPIRKLRVGSTLLTILTTLDVPAMVNDSLRSGTSPSFDSMDLCQQSNVWKVD